MDGVLLNPHDTDTSLFVSVSTYLLGKELGIEAAGEEFAQQIERPTSDSIPPAKMVARLQRLGQVYLWHGWSSDLPKLRSRAAHAAFKNGAELWVTLDDDVECDSKTLQTLLELARPNAVSVLPCRLRGTTADAENLNVVFAHSLVMTTRGIPARPLLRGGTGMMVVSRGALRALHEAFDQALYWEDDDGERKVALFEQRRWDGKWWGEDYSFCARCRELEIPIWAPAEGSSVHDGKFLDLTQLDVT